MNTSNTTNMPRFLLDWAMAKNNGHAAPSLERASTTFLLKDPTACVLTLRHYNDIICDLQDTAQSNTGTALHDSVLSFAKERGYMIEQSLAQSVMVDMHDVVITGQIDAYDPITGTLADLKFSKLANYDKQKSLADDEWFNQLSVYVWLLENVRPKWYFGVNNIINLVNIRDLSKVKEAKAGNSTDQWRLIEWDVDKVKANIPTAVEKELNTFSRILQLSETPDDELPICSEKYRYAESAYKIYKKGSKKAERGHASYETAEQAMDGFNKAGFDKDKYEIVAVGGESLKCKYYCELKDFCPHYKKMMEKENEV